MPDSIWRGLTIASSLTGSRCFSTCIFNGKIPPLLHTQVSQNLHIYAICPKSFWGHSSVSSKPNGRPISRAHNASQNRSHSSILEAFLKCPNFSVFDSHHIIQFYYYSVSIFKIKILWCKAYVCQWKQLARPEDQTAHNYYQLICFPEDYNILRGRSLNAW